MKKSVESQEYLKRITLKYQRWEISGIARIFEAECALISAMENQWNRKII